MDTKFRIPNITIETQRLLLRPFRESDDRDFFAYACVPGVGEAAGWKHHENIAESRMILREFIEEKNVFAVVEKKSGSVIGSVGVHSLHSGSAGEYEALRLKEIGYVLGKDYWGQGLMPEAVRATIEWIFSHTDLEALVCGHFTDNIRSRRVIEKCGFIYWRNVPYHAVQLGTVVDSMEYLLFKPE